MGKWLNVNSEAIYGTSQWDDPVQWSKGDKDYKLKQHHVGGDLILKQTVDPDPGYAVKQLFFTKKNEALYIISPLWPDKKLVVKNVNAAPGAKVTLLGKDGSLKWKNSGKNLVIDVPSKANYNFTTEEQYAFVFKISKIKY